VDVLGPPPQHDPTRGKQRLVQHISDVLKGPIDYAPESLWRLIDETKLVQFLGRIRLVLNGVNNWVLCEVDVLGRYEIVDVFVEALD
jgi:hypothetical protein